MRLLLEILLKIILKRYNLLPLSPCNTRLYKQISAYSYNNYIICLAVMCYLEMYFVNTLVQPNFQNSI